VAIFVVNEWLWADSSGANGRPLQLQAYRVITELCASNHRIVVIEGSAFDKKAWNICRSKDPIVGSIARTYVVSVRQNSDRCQILKPDVAPDLPAELVAETNPDDHYLLHALFSVSEAILVTTDESLCRAVRRAGLSCVSREDFLSNYF
jgi:hypothetical protein